MYSFIPAWYSDSASMVKAAPTWLSSGDGMEFDDTVNQLRVFHMAGEQAELLLPGCMPELRQFMHRQGIDDIPWWSAFDVIQNIHSRAAGLFSYLDYRWPKEMEWCHTPFLTAGYLHDKLYVKVNYGIGGHTVRLDWVRDDRVFRSDEMDDRGFVSYSTFFEGGKAAERLYFDQNNRPQIVENIAEGGVNVCLSARNRFAKAHYASMSELVEEIFTAHLAGKEDRQLIAAFDRRHNDLVVRAGNGKKMVCSFFSQRNSAADIRPGDAFVARAAAVVTDTEYLAQAVKSACPELTGRVLDISPYDARLSPGSSNHIRALKVLFYVNDWYAGEWKPYLSRVLQYMTTNRDVELTVGLGRNAADRVSFDGVEEEIGELMDNLGVELVFEDRSKNIAENEEESAGHPRISVRKCKNELQIMELMKDHRLIADVSSQPDLYLQIAGVSACIPLLLGAESRYVTEGENGMTVTTPDSMTDALAYYLEGLANWNRAMVASLRQIAQYTDGSITAEWKQVMQSEGAMA